MKIVFTYLRLVKLAWKQYRLRFDIILFSHLWLILPLNLVIDILTQRQILNITVGSMADLLTIWQNPWFIAIQLATAVINLWITLCIQLMIKANYQQNFPNFKTLARQTWEYWPRVFVTSLGITLCTLLGFALFIIPGLIIWFGCSLALPAMVWKNLQPWTAIRLSWKTVRRYWWIVPGYITITLVGLVVIEAVLAGLIPTTFGFLTLSLTITQIIQSFSVLIIMVLFILLEEVDQSIQPQPIKL